MQQTLVCNKIKASLFLFGF